jgi:hemolysin III
MGAAREIQFYPPFEERINIFSHAAGLLFSLVALALMATRASLHGNAWHIVSVCVFGASLVALYAASTIYHGTTRPRLRARLRIIDHATIYILMVGWVIFTISWGLAATGITLKLFFTGRFNLLSTLMYIFMGWMIIFFAKPLVDSLPIAGIYWLVAGGLSYTIGAVIYSIKKIPLNHAIFHLFVLLGSFCHVISVYFYVLPQ